MKIVYNEFIPFKGFSAINLFGILFARKGVKISKKIINHELIHTARRSAATNMYLTGRMKTYEIMQLTGHTSEKNFFRYIKVTSEQSAKHIAGDSFFNK